MALDEYLYGRIANFFKKKKIETVTSLSYAVKLDDIKQRLTIFSRAVTGCPIDIYPAEREGGY